MRRHVRERASAVRHESATADIARLTVCRALARAATSDESCCDSPSLLVVVIGDGEVAPGLRGVTVADAGGTADAIVSGTEPLMQDVLTVMVLKR